MTDVQLRVRFVARNLGPADSVAPESEFQLVHDPAHNHHDVTVTPPRANFPLLNGEWSLCRVCFGFPGTARQIDELVGVEETVESEPAVTADGQAALGDFA